MESGMQDAKELQRFAQLAKERHARMRERAWALWYLVLQAQGRMPGPAVDIVTGNIGPSGSVPDRGPCRMW